VSHIADLVDALAKKVLNLPRKDILILSYYNERHRVLSGPLRNLGHSKVRVKRGLLTGLQKPCQGLQVWERLVKQHEQTSTLCRVKGSLALLKQQLRISEGSSGYERALR
jgi:hypothetical protein